MENQNQAAEKQKDNNGKEQLGNYFQYAVQIIKKPDEFLLENAQGKHQFGLVTMIVFLVLVALSSIVTIFNYYDSLRYFGFSDYFSYFERAIAYGAALAGLIFVFKNYAEKQGRKYELNFFYEKLGSLLVIPSVFLVISLVLKIIDIRIHSWFSSLGYTFLYLGVFLISYLFIAKNNLKTAILFVAGFYLVYRLIYLIL